MQSQSRRRLIASIMVAALSCLGPMLWAQSGVPLAAVEANTDPATIQPDTPTPFPRPVPPSPRPAPVSADEAVYAYVRGAVWVQRRDDGRLAWHDCADPGRIAVELAAAPAGRIEVVEMLAETQSGAVYEALAPIRQAFEATAPITWSDYDLNASLREMVKANAGAIADGISGGLGLTAPAPTPSPDDTAGRCDGAACGKRRVCSCHTYDGDVSCLGKRSTCSVDEPAPTKTTQVKWNY